MDRLAKEVLLVAREVVADDAAKARRIAEKYAHLPLECDGLSRVLTFAFSQEGIPHEVMCGMVRMKDGEREFAPHYWIRLRDGHLVDYRARMWLGDEKEVPHGVFRPSEFPDSEYNGRRCSLPMNETLFRILTR